MFSKYLKSAAFLLLIYVLTLRYFLPLCFRQFVGLFTGKLVHDRQVHDQAILWGQALFNAVPGWKMVIKGKEHLPNDQQSYVIVANHESAVDILVLYYLGSQFRWLAKDTVFKLPIIGQAMNWAGYIPVTRGNRDSHKEALQRSADVLKSNISMLFFPEGTRSDDGQLKPFKAGAFVLAKENRKAILPIALCGTSTLLKKRSLSPYPATVRMQILPPVYCRPDESVEDFSRRVEDLIRQERQILARS